MATADIACTAKPSRLVRTLQVFASLFILFFALLPTYIGAANLFFYVRNVYRMTDWSLLGIGLLLLLLGLISFARPRQTARWISLLAAVGFAVVMATATGLMKPINADTNIPLLAAGAFFLIFLLSRYLARPHFQDGGGCRCAH